MQYKITKKEEKIIKLNLKINNNDYMYDYANSNNRSSYLYNY